MKSGFITIFFILIFSFSVYTTELPDEYNDAIALIEIGKRQDAAILLKRLISRYPDWGLFYLEYAANCIYLECPENEIFDYLNKAEKLLDENPRFYFYKGLSLEQKDQDESLRLYDRAISLRPTYVDALINACAIYIEKGDIKSAISYYDSIPMDKRNSIITLKIINLLIENKDFERAEKELLYLVKNHPSNELYLSRLLDFYNKTGDDKKSSTILNKLKKLSSQKKREMRPLK